MIDEFIKKNINALEYKRKELLKDLMYMQKKYVIERDELVYKLDDVIRKLSDMRSLINE